MVSEDTLLFRSHGARNVIVAEDDSLHAYVHKKHSVGHHQVALVLKRH